MRKSLLSVLLAGALPLLAVANPTVPSGKHKMHFVENKGQVHDQNNNPRNDIQFSIGSGNVTAFIGDGQLHYMFNRVIKAAKTLDPKRMGQKDNFDQIAETELYRMDVELIGANKNAAIVKEQEQSFTNNFIRTHFTSRNSKGVFDYQLKAHAYDKITYKDIYPNIDWVIYVKNDKVEYEFVVRPGGNPANIKLKYSGTTSLNINNDGSLTAVTPLGTISEKAPFSFQADGRTVASSFNLDGDVLSFNVGNYTGTLIIDPTLTWGTYFGDVGNEEYKSVQYDGTGNIYLIGFTNSTTNIATTGAFGQFNSGGNDMLVTKITSTGALDWSTFFGTIGNDVGWGIHWNGSELVLAGITDLLGDNDAYAANLSFDGTASSYAWAIGDLGDERAFSVARDGSNNIYLGMWTTDINWAGDVGQTVYGGGTRDGLLIQLDAGGSYNLSTLLGGTGDDAIISVNVSANNSVYVAGWTSSTNAISTPGTFQQFAGGGYDGFLTRYNTSLMKQMGTYWGGANDDNILAVTSDASNLPYVAGLTFSTAGIAVSGWQTALSGTEDMMVGKFNAAGMITFGTYYGGPGDEEAYAIGVDNSGNIFVGGATNSSSNIAMGGGYDLTFGGITDGALVKFNNAGTPQWGTYYGGTGIDYINGLDPDNAGFVYTAGYAESFSDISLNTTLQPTYAGGGDGVAAKFSDCTPPAQPGAISGPNPVCAGSTQTYSIAAVPGASSYTWTLPGGWTGTSTTASISVTVGTTGGAISVVANSLTCGSGPAQTLTVTVNPIPTASITPAGPTTFCQGGSVVLNANTGTGFSYAWFQGVTPVGTNSSTYTANASGNYTVQVTSGGCSATSAAVTVTVNPTPNATANSNSPVCAGQTINLNGGSTTPGATYSWLGPLVFGSGVEDPTIPNAQLGNGGVYTLTVTANGCTSTATTNVVVTAGAPATPSAINGDISICAGSTNTYDVTNDPNAASYTWTLPTGWTGASTTNSISTTANATSGTISVTATNGCGTSTAATLNITVNPLPTAAITQSGNTLNVTGTFASYQWYDGSGAIAGATGPSYTATTSGNYYCVVTDVNGCSSAPSNTITITVSVNSVTKNASIKLYPNPNSGSFTVEGAFAANDGKATIMIVDVAGRVVHQSYTTVMNGKISAQVNMNGSLAAGVYTIKVSSDAANAVIPFVKK